MEGIQIKINFVNFAAPTLGHEFMKSGHITLLIIASLLLATIPAHAQMAVRNDSSYVKVRGTDFIAPGVLIGAGLGIHFFAHDTRDMLIRNATQDLRGGREILPFDNYIQYLPVAMDLGLGFTGVNCNSCFLDRAIEGALAYATGTIVLQIAKAAFKTERPNGSADNSFPSGHTFTAFTGAELVRLEYGWGWGAGAYGIAATVGAMRVYRDWHWFSDVLAGAGLGILSANVGRWLREPVKDLLGIHLDDSRLQFGMSTGMDSRTGTPYATLSLRF